MWIRGETEGGWGRGGEEGEERKGEGSTGGTEPDGGADRSKSRGGRGVRERAGGTRLGGSGRPAAHGARAEGTRGRRCGTHHGSARFRVRRSGRRAGPGAPPPPSRRSRLPGLAGGQLRPRRSAARLPGRGAPPGRTQTAARPASRRPRAPRRPPAGTRGPDPLSPEPLPGARGRSAWLPRSPLPPSLPPPPPGGAATLPGRPACLRCPSFPATASRSAGPSGGWGAREVRAPPAQDPGRSAAGSLRL